MQEATTASGTTATTEQSALTREAANALVEDHLYLVQHLVNQLSARYPRHVDRQELWNAGAAGLVDASRRYDPSAGVPFARYASIRIRGAIIDSTRSRDFASRGVRRQVREMQGIAETFEMTHGRQATDAELAGQLRISTEELASRRAAAASATLLHLDHSVSTEDEGEATFGDLLPSDTGDSPEEVLEQRELIGTLHAAMPHLPEVQAEVLRRCYFEGELLRDVADSMGVTEARVSQIRSEALNALRAYFAESFEGVAEVAASAPGVRRRATFAAAVSQQTTWRSRLEAADAAESMKARSAYRAMAT